MVTVTVTPSQQQLDSASWNAITSVIFYIGILIVLGYLITLAIRAIINRRKK
jgi:hypothetical protein